ncbi:MAG: YceI family protein [Sulfurovaceae bacterium]|nr:YceI family protein [Sulfurovaceae bacterium]
MKKISLIANLVFLLTCANGATLSFESGIIRAHTEVFGDNSIDPAFHKATSQLTIANDISSMRGIISVSIKNFVSDNDERDSHMREAMEENLFPKASFNVKEVLANGGDNYTLKGDMTIHGVTKPMTFASTISQNGNNIHIKAKQSMKMSTFGIKPPKLLMLTVRDQVDLFIDVLLKK